MRKMFYIIPLLLMISCPAGKQKETLVTDATIAERQVEDTSVAEYKARLAIPIAELTPEEMEYGVLNDNELEGGWQLMDIDNKLVSFGKSKAFIFINYYKRFNFSPNKTKYMLPKYDDNTCFVVLYYWNSKTNSWVAEYNGGQQVGDTIHVAPLEGEFSKGKPYDIIHIVDNDGRRYVVIKNHNVLKIDGRRFIKTLP